jgi:hypothetical protein
MLKPTLFDAVMSLVPGAEVIVADNTVTWHTPSVAPVTQAELEQELARLKTQWEVNEYQRLRAPAYPSVTDQLDALWKGGDAAAEMLARVQAVKAQFPKPEGV